MARILIVGDGRRGLRLARELLGEGHVVRVVARRPDRQTEIEAAGAECFVGDPDRLVTLRPALEHVAVACWLLATVSLDSAPQLHGSRLAQFMQSLVDTTVRGVVYESGGDALPAHVLQEGERIFSAAAARNAVPARVLRADPGRADEWLAQAGAAVRSLLDGALS